MLIFSGFVHIYKTYIYTVVYISLKCIKWFKVKSIDMDDQVSSYLRNK